MSPNRPNPVCRPSRHRAPRSSRSRSSSKSPHCSIMLKEFSLANVPPRLRRWRRFMPAYHGLSVCDHRRCVRLGGRAAIATHRRERPARQKHRRYGARVFLVIVWRIGLVQIVDEPCDGRCVQWQMLDESDVVTSLGFQPPCKSAVLLSAMISPSNAISPVEQGRRQGIPFGASGSVE